MITQPVSQMDLPSEAFMLSQLAKTCEVAWNFRLSREDLENWLSNFTGEVHDRTYERQIALWLLVNFTFYNQEEVMNLCRVLFRKFLHAHLVAEGATNQRDVQRVTEELFKRTCFYHLGRPGESGGFILYLFRQSSSLPLKSFVTSMERIPDHVDRIVFVDDVCLSGDQAKKYLVGLDGKIKGLERTVLALIDTPEAEDVLAKASAKLVSAQTIDERSKCFSPKAAAFVEHDQHQDAARRFALHYGTKALQEAPLGYNCDGYAFGFFYNTPNNTLPIFWSEREGWKPVMKRYHKKYGRGDDYDYEAYI